MSDCQHFEELLGRRLADELDRDEEMRLESHLESCPTCRDLVDLHESLLEADFDLEVPEKAELTAARWSVLARLPKSRPGLGRRPLITAAAAALFLFGVALGRVLPRDDTNDLLDRMASSSATRDEAWMLSSVDLSPRDDGQVDMLFEISRPLEVTRAVEDPLVARAVEEAFVGAEDLGARIRALNTAARLSRDPAVRQTLIGAAEYDSSIAVRIQAVNLLADYRDEDRVQAALLRILKRDESVPVRLLALELLGDETLELDDSFYESESIGL